MQKKFYLTFILLLSFGVALSGCQRASHEPSGKTGKVEKAFPAKDFTALLGMEGFSDSLLQNHFKLYEGYVKNTNLLIRELQAKTKAGMVSSPDFAELKRRLGFEFNGMRLHELYFGNLGGSGVLEPKAELYQAITKEFGTFDDWKKDFIATGSLRGVGWVVLYFDPISGNLINYWIDDHQVNHPTGCVPLLVMDVWEHAYMPDYQLDRAKYMEAFFKNIDWEEVQKRYESGKAMQAKAETKQAAPEPQKEALAPVEKPHSEPQKEKAGEKPHGKSHHGSTEAHST